MKTRRRSNARRRYGGKLRLSYARFVRSGKIAATKKYRYKTKKRNY